jgi:hypothetical protein
VSGPASAGYRGVAGAPRVRVVTVGGCGQDHAEPPPSLVQVRVIALRRPGTDQIDWSPGHRHPIGPQDRIYVLATRAGLSSVLAHSQPGPA